ncbi:AAA family ATPase [Hahella aquimaris]|uniref:AAA family ATPase n=1 Tax=Hahella sp. HNIBRBA332 TaxID=3015983 RepID=UPI00273BEF10|nr:AAA family ATPase [Hahella sp. HNIBRBA332]WLQ14240.1 AAA family ATPase [Hahella sp. HNIBRBA332]
MRLASLTIGSEKTGDKQRFKNLKNVTIDFDEDEWITVVIGWNGTGKSNVLEALATIFRDLIGKPNKKGGHSVPEKPSFAYILRYFCHNKEIVINADPDRASNVYKVSYRELSKENTDGDEEQIGLFSEADDTEENLQPIKFNKFVERRDEFLPSYVFGYYSGHSQRMYEVFTPYLEKYDDNLRNGIDPGLRKMFYAKPVHSQFTLLAFMLNQESFVQQFLEEHFGIDTDVGIDSVLFVLNQPPWKSNAPDGDSRFWNSRGVVKNFLTRLYDVSLAPIRINRRTQTSLWNKTSLEYLYLYVKDLDALKKLVGNTTPREFFRDIESTYVSELIDEVRIRVKLKNNDGTVIFRELSEGEQQLLTVLGLLRFTAEDEGLFLLDEPDTHLNPQWSVDYFKYLKMFVGSGRTDSGSSHIVLNTHNPLAVAELAREQVQILYRDPEYLSISSHLPDYDPRGMGYSGIVTSDMFGLASSLDKRTQRRLEMYRALASLTDKTRIQELRFQVISQWLDDDRFNLMQRDDDYQRYLIYRRELLAKQAETEDYQELMQFAISLSAEERNSIAKQAMEEILAGESE